MRERIAENPVPQLMEMTLARIHGTVEVAKMIQERTQQRTVEEMVEVPIPHTQEQVDEEVEVSSLERVSEHIVRQIEVVQMPSKHGEKEGGDSDDASIKFESRSASWKRFSAFLFHK